MSSRRAPPVRHELAVQATSPVAFLAAGGGVALGLVTGLGSGGAVAGGLALWAGVTASAVAWRRRSTPPPPALTEPWRSLAASIEAAAARVAGARAAARPGPLADRLADADRAVRPLAATGIEVARRGDALARSVADVDVDGVRARLAELEPATGTAPGIDDAASDEPDEGLEATAGGAEVRRRTADALRSQLLAVDRARAAAVVAEAGLRLVEAGVTDVALRVEELAARSGAGLDLAPAHGELGALAEHLAGLQDALDSLSTNRGLPTAAPPTDG